MVKNEQIPRSDPPISWTASLADSTFLLLSSRFVLPASTPTSLRCTHSFVFKQEIDLYETAIVGSAKDHSSQTQTPTSLFVAIRNHILISLPLCQITTPERHEPSSLFVIRRPLEYTSAAA